MHPQEECFDSVSPSATILSAQVSRVEEDGGAEVFVEVNVSGSATDLGGVVASVEVSLDAGRTWHPAEPTRQSFATWKCAIHIPVKAGEPTPPLSQAVRAFDDCGNVGGESKKE